MHLESYRIKDFESLVKVEIRGHIPVSNIARTLPYLENWHTISSVGREYGNTQVRQTEIKYALLAGLDCSRLAVDNVGTTHLIH